MIARIRGNIIIPRKFALIQMEPDKSILCSVYFLKNGKLDTDFFSVNEKKITKLHIFVTENEANTFSLITANTEKEAKEISSFDFVVDLK